MTTLRAKNPVLHSRVKQYVNREADTSHLLFTARHNYLEICFDFAEACIEYWDSALGEELVNATIRLTEATYEYNTPLNIDDLYRFVLQAIDDEERRTEKHVAYELQAKLNAYGFDGRVDEFGGELYGVVIDLPNKLHAVLSQEALTINKGDLLEQEIDRLQLDELHHLEQEERLRLASIVLHYYNNPRNN